LIYTPDYERIISQTWALLFLDLLTDKFILIYNLSIQLPTTKNFEGGRSRSVQKKKIKKIIIFFLIEK
jgi:hypothetical protein